MKQSDELTATANDNNTRRGHGEKSAGRCLGVVNGVMEGRERERKNEFLNERITCQARPWVLCTMKCIWTNSNRMNDGKTESRDSQDRVDGLNLGIG